MVANSHQVKTWWTNKSLGKDMVDEQSSGKDMVDEQSSGKDMVDEQVLR